MGLERLTPAGLFKPAAYTQAVVARGRRMVFLAGQVSIDAEGKLVAPGDFSGQVSQVGYRPEMRALLGEARSAVFGPTTLPASTLVGVQALAEPDFLIEIEAVAVLDQA